MLVLAEIGAQVLGRNYRVREAAAWLGVAQVTVWRWIYQGRIRSAKVGRCRVIPEEALLRAIVEDSPRQKAGRA